MCDWNRDPFECQLTDLTGREQEDCWLQNVVSRQDFALAVQPNVAVFRAGWFQEYS